MPFPEGSSIAVLRRLGAMTVHALIFPGAKPALPPWPPGKTAVTRCRINALVQCFLPGANDLCDTGLGRIEHSGYSELVCRSTSAAIDRVSRNGRYPSDHYPITAELKR